MLFREWKTWRFRIQVGHLYYPLCSQLLAVDNVLCPRGSLSCSPTILLAANSLVLPKLVLFLLLSDTAHNANRTSSLRAGKLQPVRGAWCSYRIAVRQCVKNPAAGQVYVSDCQCQPNLEPAKCSSGHHLHIPNNGVFHGQPEDIQPDKGATDMDWYDTVCPFARHSYLGYCVSALLTMFFYYR